MKFTRTAIAYCGLLASVLLSHSFGNGRFISIPSIVAFSIIIVAALSISFPQELEGPRLALLVLSAQSLGHFIFGGGGSNSSMTFSHVIGGIVGYQFITRLDRVICALERIILEILIPLRIAVLKLRTRIIQTSFIAYIERVKVFIPTPNYSLRAPPLSLVN